MSATEAGVVLRVTDSPAGGAMELKVAQNYARKIYEWLEPYTAKMMVAGSIRRERPFVNDVDIVCIPKVTERRDLLGTVISRENHALNFLRRYVEEEHGKAKNALRRLAGAETPRFISGGEIEGKQVMLQLPKCQLDLWFASEETYATRLLCRTGSKEHNIWLAERATALGGHWYPYEGLKLDGRLIEAKEEGDIYAALGLEWVEPHEREAEFLPKLTKATRGL